MSAANAKKPSRVGFILIIIALVLIILGAGMGTVLVGLYNLGVEVQKEERASLMRLVAEHNALIQRGEVGAARSRYWSAHLRERYSNQDATEWLDQAGSAAAAQDFTVLQHNERTSDDGDTLIDLEVRTRGASSQRVVYTFEKTWEDGEERYALWEIDFAP